MEKQQKNKGSIMLLVVILIAVVILLNTSVMSMTVLNYRMRLTNTVLIENMQKSDSGIDEAYALSMMSYELAYHNTEAYVEELLAAINQDIVDLNNGQANYVSCENKKYIDSISLTMNNGALENQFLLYFQSSFDSDYKRSISDFHSQIDSDIKLALTGPKSQAKNKVYHVASSYENEGVTRKNSINLVVLPPDFDLSDSITTINLPQIPIVRNRWRIEYGE
jgi:hypothetical protein